MAVVTEVAMVMLPRRIPTARGINRFMHSRRTATAAESVSDLATITTVAMADTTVAMVGITVVTTDITESMEVNDLCGLVRLGKFNLPSLPVESYEPADR